VIADIVLRLVRRLADMATDMLAVIVKHLPEVLSEAVALLDAIEAIGRPS
jgi:hypothetical protein